MKTISTAPLENCNASHGFGFVTEMGIALMVAMRKKNYVVCCLSRFKVFLVSVEVKNLKLQVVGIAMMEVSGVLLGSLLASIQLYCVMDFSIVLMLVMRSHVVGFVNEG